jgi:hypothetical protein
MTFDEMRAALDTLTGLKFRPVDYKTHWTGLKDMPIDALTRAVHRAARQCSEFPSPAELRTLADAAGSTPVVFEDRSEPLDVPQIVSAPFLSKPIPVTRAWRYYCEDCSDEGWESLWCGPIAVTRKPWQRLADCGRHTEHLPHEWVQRCACQASNPAVIQRKERDAKFAAQRSERKSA